MYLALKDIQKNHPTLPEPLVVMVVGAGRGPLVRSSLRYFLPSSIEKGIRIVQKPLGVPLDCEYRPD